MKKIIYPIVLLGLSLQLGCTPSEKSAIQEQKVFQTGSMSTQALIANCGAIGLSEAEYLDKYSDVKSNGINPFIHYKRYGAAEGRCPIMGRCSKRVSAEDYAFLYPESVTTGLDAYSHYAKVGYDAGNCPVVKLASSNQACEGKPLKEIFILSGQSNAEGLGQVSQINNSHWTKLLWNQSGFQFNFWNMRFHSSWQNGSVTMNGPNFGSDVSLAAHLQKSGKSGFYIYKGASGGSALRNLGGVNEWRSRGAGGIYDEMIKDFKNAAEQICNTGYQPVVKSLFWMQGESDSNTMEIASNYYPNLVRLISELRTDILSPLTPVILGKIRSGSDSLWVYADLVRAADDNASKNLQAVLTVETNDLSYYRTECTATNPGYCKAHYDAEGMLNLGDRFFTAYSSNTSGTPSAPAPVVEMKLTAGFYRVGNTDAIYYLNGTGGSCVFTSWENFLRWGGKQDASNVTSVARLPSDLVHYGACN